MTFYEIRKIETFMEEMYNLKSSDNMIPNSSVENSLMPDIASTPVGERTIKIKALSDEEFLNQLVKNCSDRTLTEILMLMDPNSNEKKYLQKKIDELNRKKNAAAKKRLTTDADEIKIDDLTTKDTFFYTLLGMIHDRDFKKYSDFYNKVSISRQDWYHITKGSIPDKKIVFRMIIVLKLDFYECEYLMNLAGYSFQKNKKTDMILLYLIKENYFEHTTAEQSFMMVDELLEYFEESPLYSIK